MIRISMRRMGCALALALLSGHAAADHVDDVIKAEMQRRQVPGLSIAIIDGGRIVRAAGYGVTGLDGHDAVTPATLFQAGSISKPIAALGALHLVEQGRLGLDDDVNAKLTTWKIPDNALTRDRKVTLRAILSHSAGLSVPGSPGYAVGEPVPSLVQLLDGAPPANTPAVRVETVPGSAWRYSGGGYAVLQQLVIDVTGKPFADYLQEAVLEPLGMHDSRFAQPLPAALQTRAASGYFPDRSPVQGRWHVYPELASGGLWSTPSDLARLAIGIQQALAGRSNAVISAGMARQMLTVQKADDGLGVFLTGSGRTLEFNHGGRNLGFDSWLVATAETGQGAVVMLNVNDNSAIRQRVLAAIAEQYRWPGSDTGKPARQAIVKLAAEGLAGYAGYYAGDDATLSLVADGGHLDSIVEGFPDEEFLPIGKGAFQATSDHRILRFEQDPQGRVASLAMEMDGKPARLTRFSPPLQGLPAQPDPDPQRAVLLAEAVKAIATGGEAVKTAPLMSAGFRNVFGGTGLLALEGATSPVYLATHGFASPGIARNGSQATSVLAYRVAIKGRTRYVLAYMDQAGALVGLDLV